MADTTTQDDVDDTTDDTTSTDTAADTTDTTTATDETQDDDAKRLGRLEAENQRLKREAAAREKDKRKAEADRKKAEDERKAQAGEWEKLANERAERITELETSIAERDQRDAQRDQRTASEKVAEKLNFRRPRRAYALLVDELDADDLTETLGSEQLIEAALRRIARDEPELVDQTRRTGAPVNGSRSGGGLTAQQRANRTIAGLLRGTAPTE